MPIGVMLVCSHHCICLVLARPPKSRCSIRGGIGSPLAAPFMAPLATGAAGGAERIIIKTPMVLAGHRVPFLRSLSPAQSATETAGRVGTSMSYRATNLDRGYSNVPRAATSSSNPEGGIGHGSIGKTRPAW